MSFVISGNDATIIFFLLIAFNGLFCFAKVPILAFTSIGVSAIYLIAFSINYTGLNVILTLILISFMIGSLVSNVDEYKK
jgi:hypothetical protein